MSHQSIIETVRGLLRDEPEWQKRYADYAEILSGDEEFAGSVEFITGVRRRFRECGPLRFYLIVSAATKAKTSVEISLRYLGQNVAVLTGDAKSLSLSTSKFDEHNKQYFGCEIKLPKDTAWDSPKASAFRSHFVNRPVGDKPLKDELRLQSLLLDEFFKTGESKKLRNIQPVTISDLRFPMPTPLAASDPGEVWNSGSDGGDIDIFTRVGSGRSSNLCIIEVKKSYSKSIARNAIEQAIKYTVFVRELLRSRSGANWWKIFGFERELPKDGLILHAACAMPMPNAGVPDKPFGDEGLDIGGDKILLHYIYFKEDNNQITEIRSSLSKG
jgi:hypothetical protein